MPKAFFMPCTAALLSVFPNVPSNVPFTSVCATSIKTSLNKELSRVGVHEIKLQLINELPLAELDEVYV